MKKEYGNALCYETLLRDHAHYALQMGFTRRTEAEYHWNRVKLLIENLTEKWELNTPD